MNDPWANLRAKLMARFGGLPNAEDVVQEALLRTQLRLSGAGDIRSLEPFVAGVAKNVGRENQRANRFLLRFDDAHPSDSASEAPIPDEELKELMRKAFSRSASSSAHKVGTTISAASIQRGRGS